jgi:hypothetical protein
MEKYAVNGATTMVCISRDGALAYLPLPRTRSPTKPSLPGFS